MMDSTFNSNTFMAASKFTSNQNSFLLPTRFSNALSTLTNNSQQGNENTAINIRFKLPSCSENALSQQQVTTEPVPSQSHPDTDHDSLSFSQPSSSQQQQPTAEPILSQTQQDTYLNFSSYPQAGLSQQPTASEPAKLKSGTELEFLSFLPDNLFQQQLKSGLVLAQSQPNAGLDFLSFPEANLSQQQSTSEPILPQLHPNTVDPALHTLTNRNQTNIFNFFDMAPPADLLDYRILQLPERLETKKPKLNLLLQPTFTRPDDMANIIPAFSFEQKAPIFGEFEIPKPSFTMRANQETHVNNSSSFRDLAPKVSQPKTLAPPVIQSAEFNSYHRRPRNAPFSRRAPPEVAEEDIQDAMWAASSQKDGYRVQQGRISKKQTKRGGKRSTKKLCR